MKRLFLYTLTVFTLLSCGRSKSQFRLEGEFEHLEQGEFYIYSMDGYSEKPDTIKVNEGKFRYDATIEQPAVFHLLYPNYSEQIIFASPGEEIKITGDARHLKATKVEGSKANEAMTAFRLENQDKNEKDIRQAAASFIEKNPDSPVSTYLFEKYFLLDEQASVEETRKHFQTLKKAQPENHKLLNWEKEVQKKSVNLSKGQLLPDFKLTLANGKKIQASNFQGKYLLLNFWASWENSSTTMLFQIKRLSKTASDQLKIVSVSLDVEKNKKEMVERNDSVTWDSYCDYLAWDSPIVTQFNLPTVPYCLFVGPNQRIICSGSDFSNDILPEIKRTLKLK